MKWPAREIARHLALPLVSLILAIIIWFYVVGEQSVDVALQIPLKIKLASEKMSVLDSSLQDISVTLSVPRHLLSVVTAQEIVAYHEIRGVEKPGKYTFRPEESDIALPPGNIRVTRIFPEAVTVTLDEVIMQKLPIEAELQSEPAEGYMVDRAGIDLNPNAALVEGPKSKLEKLSRISTEPIDIVGMRRSIRRKASLALDPDLRPVTKDLVVDLFIPIREQNVKELYPNVAIQVLGVPGNFDIEVDPKEVTLTLAGPLLSIEDLDDKDILVFVNITGFEKGEYQVPLEVKLPVGVVVEEELPAINVKIK